MKKLIASLLVLSMLLLSGLSVCAASNPRYVKSIGEKDGPIVVPPDPNNPDVVAKIVDPDGNEIDVYRGELVITPFSKADDSPFVPVRNHLKAAYDEISAVKSLRELCDGMDAAAKRYGKDFTADDLVVRDLFNIFIDGEKSMVLDEDGSYIELVLDAHLDDDDLTPTVLYRDDEGNWQIIDPKFVIRNEDGTITVKNSLFLHLDDVGTIAFLTLSDEALHNRPTGDSFFWLLLVASAGCAAAGTVMLIQRKRKTEQD